MKIIVLGDTHGRDLWKKVAMEEEFDKLIFIGDYFDSHGEISGEDQVNNFKDIIAYKEANPDKVVLLMGNHDYHYMGMGETYSGYQKGYQYIIHDLIELNKHHLQMAYQCEEADRKFLFTHAGVTKTWCKNTGIDLENKELTIADQINDMFKYKPKSFKFTSGDERDPYGDEICQTPIWVRPKSLLIDCLDDFIHVVGHTSRAQVEIIRNIGLIDALGTAKQCLIIQDGIPAIGQIE